MFLHDKNGRSAPVTPCRRQTVALIGLLLGTASCEVTGSSDAQESEAVCTQGKVEVLPLCGKDEPTPLLVFNDIAPTRAWATRRGALYNVVGAVDDEEGNELGYQQSWWTGLCGEAPWLAPSTVEVLEIYPGHDGLLLICDRTDGVISVVDPSMRHTPRALHEVADCSVRPTPSGSLLEVEGMGAVGALVQTDLPADPWTGDIVQTVLHPGVRAYYADDELLSSRIGYIRAGGDRVMAIDEAHSLVELEYGVELGAAVELVSEVRWFIPSSDESAIFVQGLGDIDSGGFPSMTGPFFVIRRDSGEIFPVGEGSIASYQDVWQLEHRDIVALRLRDMTGSDAWSKYYSIKTGEPVDYPSPDTGYNNYRFVRQLVAERDLLFVWNESESGGRYAIVDFAESSVQLMSPPDGSAHVTALADRLRVLGGDPSLPWWTGPLTDVFFDGTERLLAPSAAAGYVVLPSDDVLTAADIGDPYRRELTFVRAGSLEATCLGLVPTGWTAQVEPSSTESGEDSMIVTYLQTDPQSGRAVMVRSRFAN